MATILRLAVSLISLTFWISGCATVQDVLEKDKSPIADADVNVQRDAERVRLEQERSALVLQRIVEKDRFQELDTTISELNAQFQEIDSQQQALEKRVEEVAILLANIGAVERQLADARREVTALNNSLAARRSAEQQLQSQVAKLRQDIDVLIQNQAAQPGEGSDRDPEIDRQASDILGQLSPDGADAFGLHLVTLNDKSSSEQEWAILVRDHRDLLRSLEPRLESVPTGDLGNQFFRLIAGPVERADDAARLCRQAERRGLFCDVRAYRGEPLGS